MLIDTLTEELGRLRAAVNTFREILSEQAKGTSAFESVAARIAEAQGHIRSINAQIAACEKAIRVCREYRANPGAATFTELHAAYTEVLVEPAHPLVARLVPRRPAPAPRTGCRACAHALLTELERALEGRYEL